MTLPNDSRSTSPPTTTEFVVDFIRDGILEGRYPPGSRLNQQGIADDAGVSLVPVREALRQLEGEGFIEIYPRRGAYVTQISVSGLKELYMIRELLEVRATELAVPRLSSKQLERLEATVANMRTATASRAFARLLELNAEFHFTIYEACERPLLYELITMLWNRSELYRRVFTYMPQRADQALGEHEAIFEACRQGDEASAAEEVRNNIQQTVRTLSEQFHNQQKQAGESAD